MKKHIQTLSQALCFALLISSSFAHAKVWRNTYLSFEAPDFWKCNLETTEWICRAEADKESKEAIIVLTAKEIGPTDSFDSYIVHMNTPQTSSYKGVAGVLSKVVYPAKKVMINEQPWIDGLQMASEVPSFFTRYLSTIRDRVAVLFTCSAHKDYYTKYSQDFFRAVQSLRVIAAKDLLSKPDNGIRKSNEMLGAPIGQSMPGDLLAGDENTNASTGDSGNSSRNLFLGLAFMLAAAGVYIYFKSKKK